MEDSEIKAPIAILSTVIVVGAIGYHLIEGQSLLDSFYWAVVTITTVGYGDLPIKTNLGKIFAIFLIGTGVGIILYTLTILGKNIVEGRIWEIFTMREKQKEVEELKNHIIICGFGDVGQALADQLKKYDLEIVVIEKDDEILRTDASEIPYIIGDATEEDVLKEAGIERAKAVFAAVPDDSDNILLVLNAKECNPDINIIARSERSETGRHLKKMGAEAVIHPDKEGGIRMAQSFLHPEITDLYDSFLSDNAGRAGALDIDEKSDLVGKSIKESRLKEDHGVLVISIKRNDELFLNPGLDFEIKTGDTLIVIGQDIELNENI